MAGGGGGGKQTTTTNPWSGQQPYLTDVFREAQQQYRGGGPQYYPGSMVTPFSDITQMGMNRMLQASGGMPQQQQMGDYLSATFGQPQVNLGPAAGGAQQLIGGIGQGQNFMGQGAGAMQDLINNPFAGQGGLYGAGLLNTMGTQNPYEQQLQGFMNPSAPGFAMDALQAGSGFGSLGEAQQFAGQADPGALGAATDFAGRTLAGDPTLGGATQDFMAANPTLAREAAGGMLGSNPFLDQTYNRAAEQLTERFQEQALPAVQAMFSKAGRTGSGIQGDVAVNAMEDYLGQLGDLGTDIYGGAYETDRGRQLQAAGELGRAGQGIYGTELGQQLGAGQLGGDLFSRANQADLGRLGLASQQYLGERGQAIDAAGRAGNLGLGFDQLGLSGVQAGMSDDLSRLGLTQSGALGGLGLNQQGLDRMLQAGGQLGDMGYNLGQLGQGGIGALGDLYGAIGQNQFRAGSLVPSLQQMGYNDINQMLGVGETIEGKAGELLQDDINRWNYYQQLPQEQLDRYSNLINQLPAGLGTQTARGGGGGSGGLMGALGGGATGAGIASALSLTGPVGWGLAGLGALGGLLG